VVESAERRKGISCSIMSLPQSAVTDTLSFIVTKGSPYKDILNYKLVYYVRPYLHVAEAYTGTHISTY
jgi:hypothetical protein